jgi:hypothetical protein
MEKGTHLSIAADNNEVGINSMPNILEFITLR